MLEEVGGTQASQILQEKWEATTSELSAASSAQDRLEFTFWGDGPLARGPLWLCRRVTRRHVLLSGDLEALSCVTRGLFWRVCVSSGYVSCI